MSLGYFSIRRITGAWTSTGKCPEPWAPTNWKRIVRREMQRDSSGSPRYKVVLEPEVSCGVCVQRDHRLLACTTALVFLWQDGVLICERLKGSSATALSAVTSSVCLTELLGMARKFDRWDHPRAPCSALHVLVFVLILSSRSKMSSKIFPYTSPKKNGQRWESGRKFAIGTWKRTIRCWFL